MDSAAIARFRLERQQISRQPAATPAQVVAALGALQAQDYAGVLWSIGLRLSGATVADIERAIAERAIVRTWPMRGTLHFVAAADVRWLLKLLAPRVIAGSARRHRQLELDEAIFSRSRTLFTDALRGGRRLTRSAMLQILAAAGIETAGQRGYHILWRLAQEGLVCFGPPAGKEQTFVLLDEWLPPAPERDREAALSELARRYFSGHGPATLRDFTWWSGLAAADARAALELAKPELQQEVVNGQTYWLARAEPPQPRRAPEVFLLPGFDEYLLGYADRSAALDPAYAARVVPGTNGVFFPTLVIDGRVAGTWKRTHTRTHVAIQLSPFTPIAGAAMPAITAAAERYGRFLGLAAAVEAMAG
jgi:hypothetical protein